MDFNKIIARAKAILLTPKTEWPVIANEPATVADLFKNYILILAAIPAVCGFLGMVGFLGVSLGLYALILGYLLSLVMVYLLAWVIDALAPSFDGQKNFVQALKTVAYSFTAGWIAGVAQIVPLLGSLIALIGLFYGIYLMYIGLPVTMKCPPEKSAGYTAVSVIVAIVLYFVVGAIVAGATGMSAMRGGNLFSGSRDAQIEFPTDSPLGKMEQWSKSVEQASRYGIRDSGFG